MTTLKTHANEFLKLIVEKLMLRVENWELKVMITDDDI